MSKKCNPKSKARSYYVSPVDYFSITPLIGGYILCSSFVEGETNSIIGKDMNEINNELSKYLKEQKTKHLNIASKFGDLELKTSEKGVEMTSKDYYDSLNKQEGEKN